MKDFTMLRITITVFLLLLSLCLIEACVTGNQVSVNSEGGFPDNKLQPILLYGFHSTNADGRLILSTRNDGYTDDPESLRENEFGAHASVTDLYTRKTVVLKNTPFYDSAAFSPDGYYVAGCELQTEKQENNKVLIRQIMISLWSVSTGTKVKEFPVKTAMAACTFSPDSASIACGSYRGEITLLSTGNGREIWSGNGHAPGGRRSEDTSYLAISRNSQAKIRALAFSKDGKNLASGSDDSMIRLWSVKAGTEVTPSGARLSHQGAVTHIEFSPDGKYLYSTGEDNRLKCWDIKTGRMILEIRHPSSSGLPLYKFSLHPGGKYLAWGNIVFSSNGSIHYEYKDGKNPSMEKQFTSLFVDEGRFVLLSSIKNEIQNEVLLNFRKGLWMPFPSGNKLFRPGDAQRYWIVRAFDEPVKLFSSVELEEYQSVKSNDWMDEYVPGLYFRFVRGEGLLFSTDALYEKGQILRSKQAYSYCIAAGVKDGRAYEGLGRCYLREKKEDLAEAAFKTAIISDKTMEDSYLYLMRINLSRNDFNAFLGYLAGGSTYNMDNYLFWFYSGMAFFLSGDYAAAADFFSQALLLNPSFSPAYPALLSCCKSLGYVTAADSLKQVYRLLSNKKLDTVEGWSAFAVLENLFFQRTGVKGTFSGDVNRIKNFINADQLLFEALDEIGTTYILDAWLRQMYNYARKILKKGIEAYKEGNSLYVYICDIALSFYDAQSGQVTLPEDEKELARIREETVKGKTELIEALSYLKGSTEKGIYFISPSEKEMVDNSVAADAKKASSNNPFIREAAKLFRSLEKDKMAELTRFIEIKKDEEKRIAINREQELWTKVVSSNYSQDAADNYLEEYPQGPGVDKLKEILMTRQKEQADWDVTEKGDRQSVEVFISKWPKGVHRKEADELWASLTAGGTEVENGTPVHKIPDEAVFIQEEKDWNIAKTEDTLAAYNDYCDKYAFGEKILTDKMEQRISECIMADFLLVDEKEMASITFFKRKWPLMFIGIYCPNIYDEIEAKLLAAMAKIKQNKENSTN
ncbi:MAG: hypothetical protein JW969_00505 [Spirochaetales bacterium]|nr:hypothetical protein [Spirochaetales bacterium]